MATIDPPSLDEASPEAEVDLALGEIARAGGFRRVTRGAAPLALARLRDLLLDAAADGADLSRAGLEGFHSWQFLATLVGTEWAAGTRRSSLAARRVLRRRLRALGVRPISFEEAAALPIGSPVHLTGTARELAPPTLRSAVDVGGPVDPVDLAGAAHIAHIGHIWSHSEMTAHNVRLAVEDGSDFFLDEASRDSRRTACVISARGHLVNAQRLDRGDAVSVFGVTDLVLDASGRRGGVERQARVLALRSGDDAPLLVRRRAQAP
jgi:hypothetical protein